jgi:hypothetical protein
MIEGATVALAGFMVDVASPHVHPGLLLPVVARKAAGAFEFDVIIDPSVLLPVAATQV